jgi:cytochrome P450
MPNRSIAREGYDDSEEFRPERFLDGQEPGYVFGFGRRYAFIPSLRCRVLLTEIVQDFAPVDFLQ